MKTRFIDDLKLKALDIFPKKTFSRAVGTWSSLRLPSLVSKLQNRIFSDVVSLQKTEAEMTIDQYPTLDALFTRRLKEGARIIDESPAAVVSPADGRLANFGTIRDGTLIQAKGIEYSLTALLSDRLYAREFAQGGWFTVYLSPHDYHRVHFPVSGVVKSYRHIEGQHFPVGKFSSANVPNLYCINERIVTCLETENGQKMAVVMVAAMGVGNMSLSYLPVKDGLRPDWKIFNPENFETVSRNRGDELGIFHLGSTVVVVFQKNMINPVENLEEGMPVSMGQTLGRLI